MEMKLSKMHRNENQPRTHFDEAKLAELANSIKEQGLLEPIVVVKRGDGYMIVAGERRFRASKMAGLEKVPVRVIFSLLCRRARPKSMIFSSPWEVIIRLAGLMSRWTSPDSSARASPAAAWRA